MGLERLCAIVCTGNKEEMLAFPSFAVVELASSVVKRRFPRRDGMMQSAPPSGPRQTHLPAPAVAPPRLIESEFVAHPSTEHPARTRAWGARASQPSVTRQSCRSRSEEKFWLQAI